MLGKTLVIGSNLHIWLWGYRDIRFVITLGIMGILLTSPQKFEIIESCQEQLYVLPVIKSGNLDGLSLLTIHWLGI